MKRTGWLCALLLIGGAARTAELSKASPVLEAMKAELDRSLRELKKQPVPPYFLSYEIVETNQVQVSGMFGTLTGSSANRRRQLDLDLRVGDYNLDNTRRVRGSGMVLADIVDTNPVPMPIEDDPAAIRALLWYQTDQKYKRAAEQLAGIKTNVQTKVENTDKAGDFSPAPTRTFVENMPPQATLDRGAWEQKVRKYTAPFQRFGNIYQATANLSANLETRWYVSSDGTQLQTVSPQYRLAITAFGKADDGMELPRSRSFFATTAAGLPDDAAVLKEVDAMIAELKALKTAPVQDAYVGPAVLSGKAAGVFFHEIFGHRIEAQRYKNEEDTHTFKNRIGEAVLPPFLSVYADPLQTKAAGVELAGTYKYDNQGVKARRVPIVENGILKNFLMSRTPVDGFPESNGHGRKQPGYAVMARQSNVFVTAAESVSRDDLKKMLLEEVKRSKLPYGLFFDEIQGGFTNTTRGAIAGFNVIPTMVYRIYLDGREELVRGVDLVGTPLTAFSKILAADDRAVAFNGMCGAESGMVPVTLVAPGMLVAQVEVQKKPKSQERSPILAPPFDDK